MIITLPLLIVFFLIMISMIICIGEINAESIVLAMLSVIMTVFLSIVPIPSSNHAVYEAKVIAQNKVYVESVNKSFFTDSTFLPGAKKAKVKVYNWSNWFVERQNYTAIVVDSE